MKKIAIALAALLTTTVVLGQSQVYDNFEGTKVVAYGPWTGKLDTLASKTGPNNKTGKCAAYTRNKDKKFDYLKVNLQGTLQDVGLYATHTGNPPKLTMKVMTTAPVGTMVEIQLGEVGKNAYPAGTHSQYQAFTTVTNAWEELTFKFSQMPAGSEVKNESVNLITVLFNPNSLTADTWYFDDLTGPAVKTAATTQELAPEGGTK